MSTPIEELQARLDHAKLLSRKTKLELDIAAQNIAQRLVGYFMAIRPENKDDFYDLLLAQPVRHEIYSYDLRRKLSDNFHQQVHIPAAHCSREVHERASFFKEHKSFQPIITTRKNLQGQLDSITARNDLASKDYAKINKIYQEADQEFYALSGIKLEKADKEKWESETLLGTVVNLVKYAWNKEFRRCARYVDDYQRQNGFSIFDLPEKNKIVGSVAAKTQKAYRDFDNRDLNRCNDIAEKAQRYMEDSSKFVTDHIVPLFGDATFLKAAENCLDMVVLDYAEDYHACHQRLSMLDEAIGVLQKAINLQGNPDDAKPEDGGGQPERTRELTLQICRTYDRMVQEKEEENDHADPEHEIEDQDEFMRLIQEQLRMMTEEASRIAREHADHEKRERLQAAMERAAERGWGRGHEGRGGHDFGRG